VTAFVPTNVISITDGQSPRDRICSTPVSGPRSTRGRVCGMSRGRRSGGRAKIMKRRDNGAAACGLGAPRDAVPRARGLCGSRVRTSTKRRENNWNAAVWTELMKAPQYQPLRSGRWRSPSSP